MWELNESAPDSSMLRLADAQRISGRLNVVSLGQAVNEITRRHESLRTSFHSRDGLPYQVIAPHQPTDIPVIDLSHLHQEASAALPQLVVSEHSDHSVDLAQGPPFSVRLLLLEAVDHLLLLRFHRIICDGWSRSIFLQELSHLYSAFSSGRQPDLPLLPVQQQDFARWQRRSLSEAALDEGLQFWRRQLSGELPVFELPSRHARPSVLSFKGAACSFEIPFDVTNLLKRFCRIEAATPFMALLAAWKVLLTRYSGLEDILVGTIVTNRESEELQRLIGLLVNTLALRTDLSGDPSYREALRRVKEVAVAAFAHRDIPFEKVVAELSPHRDPGRHPLVEVLFVLEAYPVSDFSLEGVSVKQEEVLERAARYDLTLVLTEGQHGYAGKLVYNADIYGDEQMKLLAEAYPRLLMLLLNHPDWAISTFYPFEV
jgi:hypothetical protein